MLRKTNRLPLALRVCLQTESFSYYLTYRRWTDPINTFDPFTTQFHHTQHIGHVSKGKIFELSPVLTFLVWQLLVTLPGLGNKLRALFYGPGWAPGKPRLGLLADIPDVKAPWPKHNVPCSLGKTVYLVVHFATLFIIGNFFISDVYRYSLGWFALPLTFLTFFALWTVLNLFNGERTSLYGWEAVRLAMFLGIDTVGFLSASGSAFTGLTTEGKPSMFSLLLFTKSRIQRLLAWACSRSMETRALHGHCVSDTGCLLHISCSRP